MKLPEIKTYRVKSGAVPDSIVMSQLLVAMRHGLCVAFVYDGKPRVVEVHALGISTKDGGGLLRGYQVGGEASRPLPMWTLYRTDKIERMIATFNESVAPRDGYKMGDAQMGDLVAELVV